jgi:hypothetical protein
MKKILCCFAAAALILAMLTACTSKNSGQPASLPQSSPISTAKDTPTDNPSTPTESSQSVGENARIGFLTQEYKDGNIAEIPYIEYDGETNPEIESINRAMNQGLQRVYDDFMNDPGDNAAMDQIIEIRSYPFTSPDYLQVVITSVFFPNYRLDGNITSINYDIKADKWIALQDIMSGLGLDEDRLMYNIGKLYEPVIPGQLIEAVAVKGFLIREGPEGLVTELLLELTADGEDDDPWQFIYSYTPELNQLCILNNICPFEPSLMDRMDPPLSYQMIPENP